MIFVDLSAIFISVHLKFNNIGIRPYFLNDDSNYDSNYNRKVGETVTWINLCEERRMNSVIDELKSNSIHEISWRLVVQLIYN